MGSLSPWENPFVESFNGRLRDELLAMEVFETLAEARVLAEEFRIEYSTFRPHPALGMRTLAEFAKMWTDNQPGLTWGVDPLPGAGQAGCPRIAAALLLVCRGPPFSGLPAFNGSLESWLAAPPPHVQPLAGIYDILCSVAPSSGRNHFSKQREMMDLLHSLAS